MRNSKKDVFISVLLFLMALFIIALLFLYDNNKPKQRIHAKYQKQIDATSIEESIGKYDITHYIDAQAFNKDGELLVFISASGTKYHYTTACKYLLNVETKNITEAEAMQLGRSLCTVCESNFSAEN